MRRMSSRWRAYGRVFAISRSIGRRPAVHSVPGIIEGHRNRVRVAAAAGRGGVKGAALQEGAAGPPRNSVFVAGAPAVQELTPRNDPAHPES